MIVKYINSFFNLDFKQSITDLALCYTSHAEKSYCEHISVMFLLYSLTNV